jgi:hypothetical protein
MPGGIGMEASVVLILREVPATRCRARIVTRRCGHGVDEEGVVRECDCALRVAHLDLPAAEDRRVTWGEIQPSARKAGGGSVGRRDRHVADEKHLRLR